METKEHLLRFFAYAHLPATLQTVSRPFADLATTVFSALDGPEEAKDCAVRAALPPK